MSAIKELIALQKIDLQLQDIESLLGDLPKKVEALVNEEKELTDNVENAKARLKELDLELNKCNSSIEETWFSSEGIYFFSWRQNNYLI